MITIKFKNGQSNVVTWSEDSYDDYMYDGKYFIIMKRTQWVGFYNLDSLDYITVNNERKEKYGDEIRKDK